MQALLRGSAKESEYEATITTRNLNPQERRTGMLFFCAC